MIIRRRLDDPLVRSDAADVDVKRRQILDGDADVRRRQILTAPFTFTRIRTQTIGVITQIPSSTTSDAVSTTPTTSTTSTMSTLPPSSTSTSVVNTNTRPPTSTSRSASIPVPSTSKIGSNGDASGPTTSTGVQPVGGAQAGSSLPQGAVIGIVIGCILVLLGTIVYGVRRRYVRRRIKLRKEWTETKPVSGTYVPNDRGTFDFMAGHTAAAAPSDFPQSAALRVVNATPSDNLTMAARSGAPPLTIPPPVYPTDRVPTSPITPLSAGSRNMQDLEGRTNSSESFIQSPTTGYGPPASASLFPFATQVVSTFITTLPDELSINVGETVRVLAEYDDGWALCLNMRGEQGMIPLECLHKGFTTVDNDDVQVIPASRLKRDSSLKANFTTGRPF